MEEVTVVSQGVERHEAFDEEVGQFHEKAELGYADDESIEVFTDALLHEFHFLPFHQSALGFVGPALGLAGLFGDAVEFFQRDRAALRFERVLMSVMVAAFGPGGRPGGGSP